MHRNNQMETVPIRIDRVANSMLQEVDFATVVFGSIFSDHMFTAEFQDGCWSDGLIRSYGPIPLAPNISALQYGVSVFEGMKAHRSPHDRPLLFRARENARRLQRSAARLAMQRCPNRCFRWSPGTGSRGPRVDSSVRNGSTVHPADPVFRGSVDPGEAGRQIPVHHLYRSFWRIFLGADRRAGE